VPFGYDEEIDCLTPSKLKHISVVNRERIHFPDFDFLRIPKDGKTDRQINGEYAGLRVVRFKAENNMRSSMSEICIFVPIERRSAFYIVNNFFILGLLTGMSFLVWGVEAAELADRLCN
jgi:hypothetical protein